MPFTMFRRPKLAAWNKGKTMQTSNLQSEKISLHFVEHDTQTRAELAKTCMAIGHHCELYADFSELAAYPPRAGIIVVSNNVNNGDIEYALERLANLGIWLPVVAMGHQPSPSMIVEAIKQGALDYLVLPLQPSRLAACLERIGKEAKQVSAARQRAIEARARISSLSGREREVLDALSDGGSNKQIARQLDISPRTVEIHRANMMAKLGARHSSDAIRLRLESRFANPIAHA